MGYLCLDIGSQGTVYVSGKLGRAFEVKRSNLGVPGAEDLLKLGLIMDRERNSGDALQ